MSRAVFLALLSGTPDGPLSLSLGTCHLPLCAALAAWVLERHTDGPLSLSLGTCHLPLCAALAAWVIPLRRRVF